MLLYPSVHLVLIIQTTFQVICSKKRHTSLFSIILQLRARWATTVSMYVNTRGGLISKRLCGIQTKNSSTFLKGLFFDILYGRLRKPRGNCRIVTMGSPPLVNTFSISGSPRNFRSTTTVEFFVDFVSWPRIFLYNSIL
jgi:hypothetical protein